MAQLKGCRHKSFLALCQEAVWPLLPLRLLEHARVAGLGRPARHGLGGAAAHLVVGVAGVSVAPVSLDHVRALLGDHDGGRVGVARHHVRHDRGVDHP